MPRTPSLVRRLEWFHDARLGLFIHWGLYSLLERGEWTMVLDAIPAERYAELAGRFNPSAFDADALVRMAKAAGMKYLVHTTRHADGFCLFNSKHSVGDFTVMQTPARRDLVAEIVTACRRHGLKVGLYYHLGDWREPGYFDPKRFPRSAARMRESAHRQVEELMTRYGRIDILWYDGWYWEHGRGNLWPGLPRPGAREFWRAEKLNAMVRRHQPHIIINDRSGPPEDFGTPEQRVQAEAQGRAWEACMTIGRQWGFVRHDSQRKTDNELLRHIVEAVTQGGNFLLNIGPRADGSVDIRDAATLRGIGRWISRHKPAFYGADLRPADQWWLLNGRLARRGNTLFYYLFEWPGTHAPIPELITLPRSAKLIANGRRIETHTDETGRTILKLPAKPPVAGGINVVQLDFASPPAFRSTPPCCWGDEQPR